MTQTKICQNCRKEFIIEPEDFAFYQKIKVPAPTWCPGCRWIFRLLWRNERSLYWRKCDLCQEKTLAIYDKTASFPVYCNKCWWSDKWNPLDYGQDYDFNRSFFDQLRELQNRVPHLALNVLNVKNSPYANQVWNSKDSYMCFDLGYGEKVMYSKACHFLKDTVDCSYSKKLELCYECINVKDSSRSVGLLNCEGCLDCYFLKNCRNCSSCILCTNLRGKSYYILNKPCPKEEFEKFKKEYISGSFSKHQEAKEIFVEVCQRSIHKENENLRTINCLGNHIWQSKDCQYSFNVFRSENCRFINDVDSDLKDSMDVSHAAEGELIYNSCVVGAGANIIGSWHSVYSHHIRYSILCMKNNANLFGCVSLNYKQNCIFNREHSKEEYNNLVSRITEHMEKFPYVDSKGRKFVYGAYFPPDLSPFSYNETTSQELFPITKEQAIERGYHWKDPEPRDYKITMKTEDIPDQIKDVPDAITDQIIECATQKEIDRGPSSIYLDRGRASIQFSNCTTAFKIIPQELQFYRRMNLPLPRYCPNCRHYQRIQQRNPLRLWHRQCQCGGRSALPQTWGRADLPQESLLKAAYANTITHFHGSQPCPNEFETSYSPDRPEIVYCEKCYQQEVV